MTLVPQVPLVPSVPRVRFAVLGFLVPGFGCAAREVPVVPSDFAASVTIERDTNGVPHIRAATEEAAAFGFGYAQAEDHAEELTRRLIEARGEGSRRALNDLAPTYSPGQRR